MKNLFSTLILLFAITAFAQNFEGKIMYANTYKSKNPQISSEQWQTMLGSTQDYMIKAGDYKSNSNGTMLQWMLFINKDSKLYSKMAAMESIYWNDTKIQNDEVLGVQIHKSVLEILGYMCDELVLECKSGTQKFYYNSKLTVDPKLFANHKLGNWFDYVSKSKSLPLKSIVETPQFTLESTATAVTPMKFDSKFFELPAGAKTEKSPF